MSEAARAAIQGPAIGLMVNAAGVIIAYLLFLIGSAMGITLDGLGVFGDEAVAEKVADDGLNVGSAITGIFVCGYIFWSSLQMMNLKNRTHALAGSVLSVIPCFTAACCFTSLPFAIWAWVVMRRPDVQAAFG